MRYRIKSEVEYLCGGTFSADSDAEALELCRASGVYGAIYHDESDLVGTVLRGGKVLQGVVPPTKSIAEDFLGSNQEIPLLGKMPRQYFLALYRVRNGIPRPDVSQELSYGAASDLLKRLTEAINGHDIAFMFGDQLIILSEVNGARISEALLDSK